jgi:hypothetical protein
VTQISGNSIPARAADADLLPVSGSVPNLRKKRRSWPLVASVLVVMAGVGAVVGVRTAKRSTMPTVPMPTEPAPTEPAPIELAVPTPPAPRLPAAKPAAQPSDEGISLVDLDKKAKPGRTTGGSGTDHTDKATSSPRMQNLKRTEPQDTESTLPSVRSPSRPAARPSAPSTPEPKRKTVKEGRIVDPFSDDG